MARPSTCCVVLACVHEKDGQECGQWALMTRGDEWPHCHRCKKPERRWRLVTMQELDANDAAFLRAIERLGYLGPDSHLGAIERDKG